MHSTARNYSTSIHKTLCMPLKNPNYLQVQFEPLSFYEWTIDSAKLIWSNPVIC